MMMILRCQQLTTEGIAHIYTYKKTPRHFTAFREAGEILFVCGDEPAPAERFKPDMRGSVNRTPPSTGVYPLKVRPRPIFRWSFQILIGFSNFHITPPSFLTEDAMVLLQIFSNGTA